MSSLKLPTFMKNANMPKMPSFMKIDTMAIWEYSLFFIFIIYLIFPIYFPDSIAQSIDSPLGYIVILCVTIGLFVYSHPLLAVLYIFVGYELLRRSSEATSRVAIVKYTPTEKKRAEDMNAMNPSTSLSLEEDVISQMAPIGRSDPIVYNASSYQPVAEKVEGASKFI
jgi:hypothetical protein